MMTKWSLRALCAVVLCMSLLAMSACTNESDKPFEYADDAMLTGADVGADNLSGVKLLGDIALVATTDNSGGRLAAIDLTTGRTIWSADDGDPILGGNSAVVDLDSPHDVTPPVVRDHGKGEFEVLVPYRTSPHVDAGGSDKPVSLGVASLSGDDGRAKWLSEPLITDDDNADKLMARPVSVAGDTVAAATAQRGRAGSLTTWAIDAESGNTQWTKDDVWPAAQSADTVVVEPSTNGDLLYLEEGPEREENTTPSAVDALSGKPAWDLDDTFDSASVKAAAGDYAVVYDQGYYGASDSASAGSSAGPSTLLINVDDGSTVEELGDSIDCTASATMLACLDDGKLTTISASDGSIESSWPYGSGSDGDTWKLLDVFADTVIANDRTDDNDRIQALDRFGKVRAEDISGTPQAMSEDYLVSCTEELVKCGFHAAGSDTDLDRPTSPEAEPLTFSDPLPSSVSDLNGLEGTDLSNVNGIAMADDSVIVAGSRGTYEDPVVAAVEPDTAERIWTLDQSTDLSTEAGESVVPGFSLVDNPQIIDTADGFSLLMPATSGDKSGVVALNAKTGDLESFHPLGGKDDQVDVHTGKSTHAAIEVSDEDSQQTELVDYFSPTKPKTGWTQDEYEPVHLGEDSVLVRKASGEGAERKLKDVQLLGLAKGKDLIWNAPAVREDEHPGTVMVEAGMLIVNWSDGTEVFDAKSGKSLGSIGKRLDQCETEGDTVMCDSTPDPDSQRLGSPIVFDRTKNGVQVTEVRNRFINGVSGAYDGRFFVSAGADAMTIDSLGAVIDSDLPGRFRKVSDDGFAIFMTCHPSLCATDSEWEIRRLG